jgi:hypothetical protein
VGIIFRLQFFPLLVWELERGNSMGSAAMWACLRKPQRKKLPLCGVLPVKKIITEGFCKKIMSLKV